MQRGGFVTGILTYKMDSHIHYGNDHKTYSGNGTKYNFKQNIKVKFQLSSLSMPDRVKITFCLSSQNVVTNCFCFFLLEKYLQWVGFFKEFFKFMANSR